jgi:hypothetical protein
MEQAIQVQINGVAIVDGQVLKRHMQQMRLLYLSKACFIHWWPFPDLQPA